MAYTPSPALSEAAAYLSSAPSLAKVSNTAKLELYGLYKYLTVAAAPQQPRPSLFDLTGRAKWDAWNNIGKEYAGRGPDAERRYLAVARELGWTPGSEVVSAPQGGEVWDEELGINVSLSSTGNKGGMGVSVSAIAPEKEGDDPDSGLHAFALQGNVDDITRYLAHNSESINQRDEYGYTALHLACDRGSLPVVKALIQHGANATLEDPDGLTGLKLAHIAGHDDIYAFLQTELH